MKTIKIKSLSDFDREYLPNLSQQIKKESYSERSSDKNLDIEIVNRLNKIFNKMK